MGGILDLIPKAYVKKNLIALDRVSGNYNTKGNYVLNPATEKTFKGAILPISDYDLKFSDGGTYTIDDSKLYTVEDFNNGHHFKDGDKFYKIVTTKKYSEGFNRYFIKAVDKVDD